MELINQFYESSPINNSFNQLSLKFLMCYSRFEYSLKCAGFVHTSGGNSVAQASILDFANSISGRIDFTDESIAESINYIFDNPPNELHVIGGSLEWLPLTPQSRSIQFLITCMRTTRNNLFHGNKQIPGNSLDRNHTLITAFLPIINKFLEVDDEVRVYFTENLEG